MFNSGYPLSLNGSLSLLSFLVDLFEIKSDLFAKSGVSLDKKVKVLKNVKLSTISDTSLEAGDAKFEDVENHGVISTKELKAREVKNSGTILANESSFMNRLENHEDAKVTIYGDLRGCLNDHFLSIINEYGDIRVVGNLLSNISLTNEGKKVAVIRENGKKDEKVKRREKETFLFYYF